MPYGFYGLSLFYRTDLVEGRRLRRSAAQLEGPARAGQRHPGPVEQHLRLRLPRRRERQQQRGRRDRGLHDRRPRRRRRVPAGGRRRRSSPPPRRRMPSTTTSTCSRRPRRRRPSRGATPRWSPASPTAPPRSCCRTPRSSPPCRTPSLTEDQWDTAPLLVGPSRQGRAAAGRRRLGCRREEREQGGRGQARRVPLLGRARHRVRAGQQPRADHRRARPTTTSTRPARGPATSR